MGKKVLVIHDRTTTSKSVRAIEAGLAGALLLIANKIRKDKDYPQNLFSIKQRYNRTVTDTIQSAAQAVYIAGSKYVADYNKTPPILTSQDLQNIQRKTQDMVHTFWNTLQRDASNTHVIAVGLPKQLKAVNMPAATQLIATAAVTTTLALATIDKSRQSGDSDSEVIFITALDERVCPICRPLHGKRWKINDPNIIQPVIGTHPNCRCRLLLKDKGGVFNH